MYAYTCDAVEDTPLVVNSVDGVRANDIDTDNTPFINPLLARRVANPTNGTLTLDQFGDFTYVPDADFHGVDSFTYLVNDGAFDSNIATVTIHVASVNDTPTALDDYYSVAQDTPLTVDASTGVQANDSDVDGDILNVRVLSDPANGALTLNPDGSFIYTPNANFTGADGFTYVANDSLIDSRTVTVAVTVNATTPPATGTRFYVVDFDDRATFEYDTNGELVETYGLPNANRKPLGVAANADGSLIWTIDKQKRVFIYDNAGTELGMWVPQGLTKPDGIATDGTDILIVDRDSDTVFRYAGEANRRNGEAAATSSFALDRANGNPKGITTDGTSIWVVNSAGTDRVFKYDMTGTFLGRWDIDPANDRPTGITIDPTGTSDAIWIVDNLSDTVYQYDGGATRIGGSAVADSVFTLAATNTNPQGIADPSSLSATEILVQSDASAPTLGMNSTTSQIRSSDGLTSQFAENAFSNLFTKGGSWLNHAGLQSSARDEVSRFVEFDVPDPAVEEAPRFMEFEVSESSRASVERPDVARQSHSSGLADGITSLFAQRHNTSRR